MQRGERRAGAHRPVEPRNPVSPDSASIARGEALYAQHCIARHGGAGRGDGPQAAAPNPLPPDMTQTHTAYHTDGYLFNAITNGFPGTSMAARGGILGVNEGRDLVNYLRELNPPTANGATPPPFNQLPTVTPSPSR